MRGPISHRNRFDNVAKVPGGDKMVLPNPDPKIVNFWPKFGKSGQKVGKIGWICCKFVTRTSTRVIFSDTEV